jgi:hypothetical protein
MYDKSEVEETNWCLMCSLPLLQKMKTILRKLVTFQARRASDSSTTLNFTGPPKGINQIAVSNKNAEPLLFQSSFPSSSRFCNYTR